MIVSTLNNKMQNSILYIICFMHIMPYQNTNSIVLKLKVKFVRFQRMPETTKNYNVSSLLDEVDGKQ